MSDTAHAGSTDIEVHARRGQATDGAAAREGAGGPLGAFGLEGVRVEDRVTLVLHGDVDDAASCELQAVLDHFPLLRPLHLVVDLSDVERVSLEALRMIDRRAALAAGLVLRSPSPSTRSDLMVLGRSQLIETESMSSPSSQRWA